MKPYLFLALAILFEVFGSSCLQASQQLTRFWPSVGIGIGFAGAFYFFMQVLRYMPLGITYAIWAGAGILLVTLSGWIVFGQRVDLPAVVGIALIIAGIAVIQLWSATARH